MGAYAPLTWLPDGFVDDVVARVAQPTVDEMRARDIPFVGVLYIGLALTGRGLRVVEFNARFGDPETQSLLALLRNPLAGLLHAAATGRLADHEPLHWAKAAAVTVVLASGGYPAAPEAGKAITGVDPGSAARGHEGAYVLQAGTRDQDGTLVTAGGRVLSVVGLGADVGRARAEAYERAAAISFDGVQMRTDIAAAAATG